MGCPLNHFSLPDLVGNEDGTFLALRHLISVVRHSTFLFVMGIRNKKVGIHELTVVLE